MMCGDPATRSVAARGLTSAPVDRAWFSSVGLLDGWAHCPRCAHELTHHDNAVACAACGFLLYAHSSVAASALPEDDAGRVLLARRAGEPFAGLWDAVGGFLDEGEHPLDGLRREVLEETGLSFEIGDFLGIWMGRYGDDARATLNLFWTGRIAAGTPHAADDVAELRWFGLDEVPPPEELAFDGLVADVLARWRDQHA
jgi:8-oxo-dGTP diphosphatase